MDDDVTGGEDLTGIIVQSEPVGPHVAGDRRHPGCHLGVEPVAVGLAEAIEAVVLEDLTGGPLHGARAPAGADQEHDLAVGDGAQQPLHQGGSQEAGGTGDKESLAGEGVSDAGHRICLPYGK